MKVKQFLFLIISVVLIMGCSKQKQDFSYTLENSFSLGSMYAYGQIFVLDDRIITLNDAAEEDIIKSYDFAGNLLDAFGNKGNGPNEFSMPFVAWYNADSSYTVYDFGHMKRFYFGNTTKPPKSEMYYLVNHFENNHKIVECAMQFDTNPGYNITINDSLIHHLPLTKQNWVTFCHANPDFITVFESSVKDDKATLFTYNWLGELIWKKDINRLNCWLNGSNSKNIIIRSSNENDFLYSVYNTSGDLIKEFQLPIKDDRNVMGINEEFLVMFNDSGEETMLEIHRID